MSIWKFNNDRELAALGPGLHSDGGGLYVKVSKNGKGRSWVLRYTDPKGRERRMGLGSLKTVSAQEAREKAHEWNKVRDVFKDPIEERRAMRTQAKLDTVHKVTVKTILDEYFKEIIEPCTPDYRYKTAGYLELVAAELGTMQANMVTRELLLQNTGLGEKWRTNPVAARAFQGHLKAAWELAIFNYGLKENPADFKHPRAREHQSTPRLALPYEDISRFMVVLRNHQDKSFRESGHPPVASLLEWVILSGTRIGEASKTRWKDIDDIDEHKGVWTIQPPDQKTGHRRGKVIGAPFQIPITAPMKDVLEQMKRRYPDRTPDDLVFPSPLKTKQGKPLSKGTVGHFLRACIQWPTKIHAHGFRSTFTMWAEERDYSRELIERQVNHKPPKVQRAYRHYHRPDAKDPMLELRRVMMEKWGQYCARTEPPAHNVVDFKTA
jgi:integrase